MRHHLCVIRDLNDMVDGQVNPAVVLSRLSAVMLFRPVVGHKSQIKLARSLHSKQVTVKYQSLDLIEAHCYVDANDIHCMVTVPI